MKSTLYPSLKLLWSKSWVILILILFYLFAVGSLLILYHLFILSCVLLPVINLDLLNIMKNKLFLI